MTERLSRELNAFYELARAVAASPYEGDEISAAICREIRSAFGLERALVVRYDAHRRTLHAPVQQGVDWPGEQWLDLDRFGFLVQALEAQQAVCVADAAQEAALPRTIIDRFGVTSLVGVPLMIEGRCIGFVVADKDGRRFSLDEEERALLTTLGMMAAVFIERADQHADAQDALAELRRLDRAKSDFISIASHELRTPIAVVHGITSTLHLRGNELRQDQLVELRAALFEQSSRLYALTESLLDLSRFDAGVVRVREERVRPREVFDGLIPRIAPDRAADIEIAIEPEVELATDPYALERIITNLVTNALRYGRPPVTVRGERNGDFRLVVEDRGDGVEPAFVPKLFERFSRSEHAREAVREGAGLGLAIASSFARELGGTLTYEDAKPRGARFTLALPASPDGLGGADTAAATSRAPARGDGARSGAVDLER